jgi:DNA-binding NtrC family response regulator
VDRGRYAPGERALRQLIGALARRGDWTHAARGGLRLAQALVRRGRPDAALEVLRDGAEHRRRVGAGELDLDAAILSAHAWMDLARCDESRAAAGGAIAAARSTRDEPRTAAACLALARASIWSGEYGDALRTLATVESGTAPEHVKVSWHCHAARAHVGAGDFQAALAHAAAALAAADHAADPGAVARACCGAAFVRLAAGDVEAAQREIAAGLAGARSARDALRAIRLRLLGIECARRAGRTADAAATLRRLEALAGGRLPPLLRARCSMLKDLLAGTSSGADESQIASRHIAASGLRGLGLFVPAARAPGARAADELVRGVVDILSLCHRAEDELPLLAQVCATVRRQLHAAAVAFVGIDRAIVCADGGRLETDAAERAIASGLPIDPHRAGDRVEAAVPVRCGAECIGALAARWPIGTPHDLSHATAALTMAAAAAAPVLASARARAGRAAAAGIELLGVSSAIAEVRRAVERAAAAPFAVLVQAESGSGKELVARALHRAGPRRDRTFCALNCAALPDDLVESELFGHARGAFTGAVAERPGVFEEAHGGTLFLDEVGELSPRAQAKLLRIVQDGELRRIGENVSRRIDVRLIAATNRDLRAEAAAGRFRLDLLYRLDVVRITIPPLRERREDIAVLAQHFWADAAGRVGSRATLAAATIAALARYDWPGNVRELQNVLAALAVRSPRRGTVPPEALPPPFETARPADTFQLEPARKRFEEQFVRAALVRTGGHRGRAAEELGVTRQGLTKLMARLGIDLSPG